MRLHYNILFVRAFSILLNTLHKLWFSEGALDMLCWSILTAAGSKIPRQFLQVPT